MRILVLLRLPVQVHMGYVDVLVVNHALLLLDKLLVLLLRSDLASVLTGASV